MASGERSMQPVDYRLARRDQRKRSYQVLTGKDVSDYDIHIQFVDTRCGR